MPSHRDYAQLLLQTHRPAEAEKAARAGLEAEPENPALLHVLGSALVEQGKLGDARAITRQLIGIAPAWEPAYLLLTSVELESRNIKGAEQAAREALRLSPNSVVAHHNMAACLMRQSRWEEALREAEAGLALDPEHDGCANLRSTALANLGRNVESWHSTANALRRNPENSATHVTAGYVGLQAGERDAALQHFTEALRLDPGSEQARHGLLMALRTRNPIYRQLLRYSFWMLRLTPAQRWKVAIGAVIAVNLVDYWPGIGVWGELVEIAYVSFAMLTWVGPAFFDFLLLIDRRLRHVLALREQLAAVSLILCLAAALGWVVAGVGWEAVPTFWAMNLVLYAIPLTRAFRKRRGWRQPTAVALAVVLGVLVAGGLAQATWAGSEGIATVTLLLLVIYTWCARYLS